MLNVVEGEINYKRESDKKANKFFTLQHRETIQLYQYKTNESVHALFNVLLSYCAHLKKDITQTGICILAPKPFINCLYKECNLTFNGKVSSG